MSVSLLVGEYIVISSPLIEVVVSYIKKLVIPKGTHSVSRIEHPPASRLRDYGGQVAHSARKFAWN